MVRKVSNTQKAFNVWGIILASWAVYRATIGANSSLMFDEFIFKPAVFLWPVLYYLKNIEKKHVLQELWIKFKKAKQELIIGLLIALPAILSIFIMQRGLNFGLQSILLFALIAGATTITEETLSRGFVATNIYLESKSVIKTIFQAGILHMFLRVPRILTQNALYGDKLLMAFVAEAVLSFVLTAILVWRKNLITVYVVRFMYTFLMLGAFYSV